MLYVHVHAICTCTLYMFIINCTIESFLLDLNPFLITSIYLIHNVPSIHLQYIYGKGNFVKSVESLRSKVKMNLKSVCT